jgi:acylphosphatase
VSGPGDARLHVRVEGRVQGVGFRRFVQRVAGGLGLGGWTRNLSDGSVEVLAVGTADDVTELRRRLLAGPPYAGVERLVELPSPDVHVAPPFRVLPDAAPGAPIS